MNEQELNELADGLAWQMWNKGVSPSRSSMIFQGVEYTVTDALRPLILAALQRVATTTATRTWEEATTLIAERSNDIRGATSSLPNRVRDVKIAFVNQHMSILVRDFSAKAAALKTGRE